MLARPYNQIPPFVCLVVIPPWFMPGQALRIDLSSCGATLGQALRDDIEMLALMWDGRLGTLERGQALLAYP